MNDIIKERDDMMVILAVVIVILIIAGILYLFYRVPK